MARNHRTRPSREASEHRETFSDWVGTIGLQQDIRLGPRLESDLGLDRGDWFIVAINVDLSCVKGTPDRITIDAVDLGAFHDHAGSGSFFDILALADAHGALPVTRIELSNEKARNILRYMTKGWIQLHMSGLDASIKVVAHRTQPGTDAESCALQHIQH
ncbi:hypothetical protein A5719_11220 [Mycolicibacterium peregrinum]|uniref:hypothetical protein n=1 Tax=Mycolicibacterium peregrinum TaxID=43304 RepID=UPI0007EB13F2|nr:hypothetical protein [Mycolicibacterium peregrinum]OBF41934.1 hypothetical protein A5719_11220 [Mycolicibacterium peregrinum]